MYLVDSTVNCKDISCLEITFYHSNSDSSAGDRFHGRGMGSHWGPLFQYTKGIHYTWLGRLADELLKPVCVNSCTLFFPANSFLLALSMSAHLLVRSYSRITNLSIMHIASIGMSHGAEDSSSSECEFWQYPAACPWSLFAMPNKTVHSVASN